jgi:hypothetical protein
LSFKKTITPKREPRRKKYKNYINKHTKREKNDKTTH